MTNKRSLISNLDWWTILLYFILVIWGWITIYSAAYSEAHPRIWDPATSYGKQLIWIGVAIILAVTILFTDSKFFSTFAMILYILVVIALLAVLLFGREVHGSKGWFEIGGVRLQPAEFSKYTTALGVSFAMSRGSFRIEKWSHRMWTFLLFLLPMGLIVLQNDLGSALVYMVFLFVLYREGMSGRLLLILTILLAVSLLSLALPPFWVILIIILVALLFFLIVRRKAKEMLLAAIFIFGGFAILLLIKSITEWRVDNGVILAIPAIITALIFLFPAYKRMKNVPFIILMTLASITVNQSVDYLMETLRPHQRERILNLVGKEIDPHGAAYNVIQSKIAIGSGSFLGKGYMHGSQTRLNFVPEQDTDFIFCTVGEELGFVGSAILLILFTLLLLRLIKIAERQRSVFSRVFGYSILSIFAFHFFINIGMTIGIVPVIGIPLPFFSYGGSSLLSFTLMLFTLLRLDINRKQLFR